MQPRLLSQQKAEPAKAFGGPAPQIAPVLRQLRANARGGDEGRRARTPASVSSQFQRLGNGYPSCLLQMFGVPRPDSGKM